MENKSIGKIIEFNGKNDNKGQIELLQKEMSEIISNAEMIETEDGDIVMDAISEMKCNAVETKINLELLKGGYSVEEVYG